MRRRRQCGDGGGHGVLRVRVVDVDHVGQHLPDDLVVAEVRLVRMLRPQRRDAREVPAVALSHSFLLACL
jgi:hypothetical protein